MAIRRVALYFVGIVFYYGNCFAVKVVDFITPGRACMSVGIESQFLAAARHPSSLPRRVACHESERRHVARHDASSADKGVLAYRDAAYDRYVSSNRRPSAQEGRSVLVFSADEGARVYDVGEHGRRTDEDIVFESHAIVYGDVVLDSTPIADTRCRQDDHILP